MPNFDISILICHTFCTFTQIPVHYADSDDSDQTWCPVVSEQGLYHLQMSPKCLGTELF